jgi:hypothetical protein
LVSADFPSGDGGPRISDANPLTSCFLGGWRGDADSCAVWGSRPPPLCSPHRRLLQRRCGVVEVVCRRSAAMAEVGGSLLSSSTSSSSAQILRSPSASTSTEVSSPAGRWSSGTVVRKARLALVGAASALHRLVWMVEDDWHLLFFNVFSCFSVIFFVEI